MSNVFVRAKTSDDRWASVDAEDLDEKSFRQFVLQKLMEGGLVVGVMAEWPELKTPLTKRQAEK